MQRKQNHEIKDRPGYISAEIGLECAILSFDNVEVDWSLLRVVLISKN